MVSENILDLLIDSLKPILSIYEVSRAIPALLHRFWETFLKLRMMHSKSRSEGSKKDEVRNRLLMAESFYTQSIVITEKGLAEIENFVCDR